MLFSVGAKVRFRYTGEMGTVTAILGDGMLQVRLASDPAMEIPTFEEDLSIPETAVPIPPKPLIKGNASAPVPKTEPPARRAITAPYIILKPQGVQLVFEPMPGRDGTVMRYKAWLVNDTGHEFIIEFDLTTAKRDVALLDDKLPAATALELGDLLSDDLNEHPEVWISLKRITTAGPDEPLEKLLKIKAKQFFHHFKTAPILGVPAYHFLLFDQFDPAAYRKNTAEDLRDYTKQAMIGKRPRREAASRPFRAHDVEAFAQFIPEIDLHTQTLLPGHRGVDKGEILRLQMQHFQRFLEKAVLLGVPNVFVIHGVGEGKLRDAIAVVLKANPHVLKFKNEYHHKYGYGATEVIFD